MQPRVLVIENDAIAPLDLVEQWLTEAGLEVEITKPHLGQPLPSAIPADYAGMIVLGGAMGAHDDEDFPWLTSERALMKDAIANDFPFVGICLGAQVLATAVDGKSVRTPKPEAGVELIQFSAQAASDPLFRNFADKQIPAVTWHQDYIVDLPADVQVFGSTKDCPVHAYRIGSNVYGMQFHPEVSANTVARWPGSIATKIGKTPSGAVAEVEQAQAQLIATWKPVFQRWANLVKANLSK